VNDHRAVHEMIWAPLIAGAFAAARFVPFQRFPIPCPFRSLTGIPCPTCGGTRAMIAFAHLDFPTALAMNPLVAVFAVLALVYLVHSVRVLITRRPWRPEIPKMFRPAAIAAVLVNWGYLIAVGR
jgi:hypothetical protein